MLEKRRDLRGDGGRLAGHQEVKVDRQGVDQPGFVYEMRQGHQQESEQGNQRKQRVIGDGPRQQKTLVPPKVGHKTTDQRQSEEIHSNSEGRGSLTSELDEGTEQLECQETLVGVGPNLWRPSVSRNESSRARRCKARVTKDVLRKICVVLVSMRRPW